MTSAKNNADLEALASEVCDLWQDYFEQMAGGSSAKAEFVRMLEPQRRLFADFVTLMQHKANGQNPPSPFDPSAFATKPPEEGAANGAASAALASDDGALRLAQLAHRVAELEKRLARLENRGVSRARKAGAAGEGTL